MSSSTKRIRRRPEQAEAEILDAASELLEVSAFRDITVTAVMERTGMQRPAFYKYFGDLNALVVRLLARIEGEMMDAAAIWLTDHAGGPRKLGDALKAAIDVFAKHGHVLAAAHAASFQGEAVERYYRYGFLQAFVDAVTARIEADNAAGHADVPDPGGGRPRIGADERRCTGGGVR